jgi:hypothetical protein
MAFPSFDTATGRWAAQANISWVAGPVRESEFVRFSKRVGSEAEAVASALSAARAWIDKRERMRDGVSPRVIQEPRSIRALASGLMRGSGNVPFSHTVKSSGATRLLTFNRFKALMGKSGWSGSEQSLHKSYAALLQLRKQNHRSWAQIKSKIRNSQEGAMPAQVVSFTAKARLPLTIRDWRRII